MKIVVLTKNRLDYYGNPIGLNNSASFITSALNSVGHEVTYVPVVDANSIDAVVTRLTPKLVVLEALWVTPEKMREVASLHKDIKWVVRVHSNIPFLALEGMAIDWIKRLAAIPGVYVAANNVQTQHELNKSLGLSLDFLPNIYEFPEYAYEATNLRANRTFNSDVIDVSCFGAIRPFKNHLIQALAAITYANDNNQKLRFHINATRVEQKGDSVLQNMVAAFIDTQHEIVFHDWASHEHFLQTVAQMDLGLQVSFTESFNLVTADHVHIGVPIVVSPEINWLLPVKHHHDSASFSRSIAIATDMNDIVRAMSETMAYAKKDVEDNKKALRAYNDAGYNAWNEFINSFEENNSFDGNKLIELITEVASPIIIEINKLYNFLNPEKGGVRKYKI